MGVNGFSHRQDVGLGETYVVGCVSVVSWICLQDMRLREHHGVCRVGVSRRVNRQSVGLSKIYTVGYVTVR